MICICVRVEKPFDNKAFARVRLDASREAESPRGHDRVRQARVSLSKGKLNKSNERKIPLLTF